MEATATLVTGPETRTDARGHAVLIVPRGEAIRNFIYSATLRELARTTRVSLLSVVAEGDLGTALKDTRVEGFYPLEYFPPSPPVAYLRAWIDLAHFRYLETDIGREMWARAVSEQPSLGGKAKKLLLKSLAYLTSNERALRVLSAVERKMHRALRPTDDFRKLFQRIQPTLVFNCSHIHGPAAEEPLRAAADLGIPTAGFIFSWDNLYSRGRILAPYDDYLVWHERMKSDLLRYYPSVSPERVHVTGTPQFDFHFERRFDLDRRELCRGLGIDPSRRFILYTTGVDRHFPEEHRHVEEVIGILQAIPASERPQLVVRTYVKGTSGEMKAIGTRGLPGVVFPEVLWDEKWYTPHHDDLAIYNGLLRHCAFGINVASTVSLELLMYDRPVINLGFDPPGSHLPAHHRFLRHLRFDHYRPVAESGAVVVVQSTGELREAIHAALADPGLLREERRNFLQQMFGPTLDGLAGKRVAEVLSELATRKPVRAFPRFEIDA